MNWKRILTALAGSAPTLAALGGLIPKWIAVPGALITGIAINAEKLLAKRAAGAPTFNTLEAEAKVAKMKDK